VKDKLGQLVEEWIKPFPSSGKKIKEL